MGMDDGCGGVWIVHSGCSYLDVTHNNINVMEHSVSVSRLTDLRISDVASVECTE